jgi:hypothetical protein
VLAHEPAIWQYLAGNSDYIALCHWNANVDNAWFYTDAAGELQCGLMDWGCVGRMNVAMAVWGALSAAETALGSIPASVPTKACGHHCRCCPTWMLDALSSR